jgi:hypothetical protein
VGPGSRPADTRHPFGGFNTPLTSRVSGTREIRERKFEPSTREVTSSEYERRKVNITSRGFGRKGAKVGSLNSRRRERREVLVLSLAGGRARRALMEERAITTSRSRVSGIWRGRVGSHDSQTHEIASCRKGPVDR